MIRHCKLVRLEVAEASLAAACEETNLRTSDFSVPVAVVLNSVDEHFRPRHLECLSSLRVRATRERLLASTTILRLLTQVPRLWVFFAQLSEGFQVRLDGDRGENRSMSVVTSQTAEHLHRLLRAVCLWDPAPVPEVLRHSSPVRREDNEAGVRFQLELHDPRVHRHQLVWRGLLVGPLVCRTQNSEPRFSGLDRQLGYRL